MSLPIPNLDDRRFQDYVDDAKRYVQQKCPEWTDHNVSDPGVTLIETFASMVDQLGYRLNRVPDRLYVKFLELIGVGLYPPSAARAEVTFWLSAPQDQTVTVPRASRVSTTRVDRRDEPVVFETLDDLPIYTTALSRAISVDAAGAVVEHTETLAMTGFPCFSLSPAPGDTLVLGLSSPVPSNIITLRFQAHLEGVGVDPENPPLVWEMFDGGGWHECEVERDDTGGLNRAGDIILHVPRAHAEAMYERRRGAWVRCRVTEPEEGQPFYSSTPYVDELTIFTVGGTTEAVHGTEVDDEIVGISEGMGSQRFEVRQAPVVPVDYPIVLDVAAGDGWREWHQVDTFAFSGPDDLHFVLDPTSGEISFGPAVRLEDGSMRRYGAIPPKGAPIRIRRYRSGGGWRGNVARGALNVMKTSIPFVARVENRFPARGGVDGEELENAKQRGPIALRTLGRAVTVEDYEVLARQAAPEVARVKCVPAGTDGSDQTGVRVLLVPAVADDDDGTVPFERLAPSPDLLARVAAELNVRRTIGARVVVEPPYYQGVTVVAELRARPTADPGRLHDEATRLLYTYLHPVLGGPDGHGWPFGRPVHAGELHAVLQKLYGVDLVEDVRLYPADPVSGQRGKATARLELAANAIFFPYSHEVRVDVP